MSSSNLAFARGVFAVTASANPLPFSARGVRIGTAGTLTFVCPDGTGASITVAVGEIVPIEMVKITACPAGTLGFI